MAEYIIKQKVTDRMGCCLANAKAEYKSAKDEFTKARFGDYISAIQAMIDVVECSETADVQPIDRWISCKEQLPEVGQPVLIYYPYWTGLEVQTASLDYDKMTFDICGEFNASVNKVTHWQPLPEPPEKKKG